ncbi:MAG: methyltransferase domain-containing protein [Alphaproteobacteria bacterium]|nr:methyltransferase domain-containing protein [Alphaproteobacteria bacterium]
MSVLFNVIRKLIRVGRLDVVDVGARRYSFGDATAKPVVVRLHDSGVARALLADPYLALGEAYMNGRLTLESGSIADLLELIARNFGTGFGNDYWEVLARVRYWMRRLTQRNHRSRAERNAAHHYDLSGQLYDLFLDADKQYSCAFYESPNDTLETAQLNKKRRIAAKLVLKPGQRVLDIGSGWGGLGLHLAAAHNVDVTGVTLSREQLRVADARAEESEHCDRLHFRLQDYRDVSEKFDRIVSAGMFEHVGVGHFQEFFRKVSDLLTDDGIALVHSIGRSDGPGATNPWIAKYIFPGGYTPALSEVLPAAERAGLIVTDVEILRLHYAYTLAEWRRRFVANWERARELYDERFCRMWEFYLAGCEMGFRHQGLMAFQLQLAKRVDAAPLTRDYMMPGTNSDVRLRLAPRLRAPTAA